MDSIWTKTITVRVAGGSKVRYYTIHEHILRSIQFFNNALRHDWKEARERLIKLPKVHPDIFDLYIQWIYSHNFNIQPQGNGSGIFHLAAAYVFGQFILDGDSQDVILDNIVKRMLEPGSRQPELRNYISWIYDHTYDKSHLRRLAVDSLAFTDNMGWVGSGRVYSEASGDIVAAQQEGLKKCLRPKDAPFRKDTCSYHNHYGGTCYKVKFA